MPLVLTRAVLFLLALLGLGIATYFTGVAYRLIPPDARFIPRVCRLGEDTCRKVVDTPRARVFGLPNSLLGMLYYLALMALAAAGGADEKLELAYRLVAWGTVALGVFLTYSLLFITRVPCVLCFTSHALNLVIAIILTWVWRGH
jgi:uncharacterized membrane protein